MGDSITYKDAGVDIDEGDRMVDLIKPLARKTFRPEVRTDLGGFGALFALDLEKFKHPLLVSGTDGVGTKLIVAREADKHDTVGIDLVAMCVNDIAVLGAEPLFFLDYFATGHLDAEAGRQVVVGIAKGCELAGCSLIGGETAELPGMMHAGEYELAGFSVGAVDRDRLVDGRDIRPGDAVIGLASSGVHSNGFSLARKIVFERMGLNVHDAFPGLEGTVADALLEPTRIYVKSALAIAEQGLAKGFAHITGGGLPGNLHRVMPEGVGAKLQRTSWPELEIFKIFAKEGNVPREDMDRTFNCGVGFCVVCRPEDVAETMKIAREHGEYPYEIGQTCNWDGNGPRIEIL